MNAEATYFDTNAFKTRTIFEKKKNPSLRSVWPIAIDMGYSAVKVFSPNAYGCFPYFAIKKSGDSRTFGNLGSDYIEYEDEFGNAWIVGVHAQDMLRDNDTTGNASGIGSPDRVTGAMFKVLLRVGLALGCRANEYGNPAGKKIVVQTGLPPLHISEFAAATKEAFVGEHHFKMRRGGEKMMEYKFNIKNDDVYVIEQPLGSLIGAVTDIHGHTTIEGSQLINSNILVADPGYGTADTFNITNHTSNANETWTNFGMYRILKDTCDDIKKQYSKVVTVPALQKSLKTGEIKLINRATKGTEYRAFGDILEKNSHKVCEEFLAAIDENYDNLFEHDYIIVTGGLGAAWYDQIKEHYANNTTLKVIQSNMNDDSLEAIFSNVRGYYMYVYNEMKKLYQ